MNHQELEPKRVSAALAKYTLSDIVDRAGTVW